MPANKENFRLLAEAMRQWLNENLATPPAEFDMAVFASSLVEDRPGFDPAEVYHECETCVCAAGFAAQCGIGTPTRGMKWSHYVRVTFFGASAALGSDDMNTRAFAFGGGWATHDNSLESAYHRIAYVAKHGRAPAGFRVLFGGYNFKDFRNFRMENSNV